MSLQHAVSCFFCQEPGLVRRPGLPPYLCATCALRMIAQHSAQVFVNHEGFFLMGIPITQGATWYIHRLGSTDFEVPHTTTRLYSLSASLGIGHSHPTVLFTRLDRRPDAG